MDREIKVVELFAGVGGFRLGLEGWKGKSASSHYTETFNSPYKVIWSNQWEPSSKKPGELQEANRVYQNRWHNFKDSEHNPDDINLVASPDLKDAEVNKLIPDHDLLVGGFPCQDYSVAGVNTKGIQGKKGVLWWNILKILKVKRPKMIFLENVDRLLKSPTKMRGRDFAVILSTLNELDYSVEWKVINAAEYGMPQRRKRVYILAYHKTKLINTNSIEKWLDEDGVFAKSFPSDSKGEKINFELDRDLKQISDNFTKGKFLNSGVMHKGSVLMSDFNARCSNSDFKMYSKSYRNLGDIILKDKIDKSYFIDQNKILEKPILKRMQAGFEIDKRLSVKDNGVEIKTELEKWIYLKGRKAEERVSSKGKFYYKEGPLSLTDSLTKPSRTIITSEGGSTASRFKHLIEIEGKYRRLHPIELERLNMFPDNHTQLDKINDNKRAFFMGNALVVGVIERVGKILYNHLYENK